MLVDPSGKRVGKEEALPMQHLESGVIWGIVLLVAGVLLVLEALGIELVSEAFWGILLLVAGGLVLLRALGGGRR